MRVERTRRHPGFTLVELLVVLAIAAAMASVSLALFSGAIDRAELRETAVELATMLRHARSRAIAQREEASVVCDVDEASERACRIPRLEKTYALGRDLHIELVTAQLGRPDDAAEVRFFPDGTSSGGEIKLSRAGTGYVIRVEWLTGQVSVREGRRDAHE
ncbi:MAG: prepilin-type N-terminal cleavage/methylation domain-containing protein [Gammaproteobacteria bacterium]|nr:prepilin-type N-terminal cleavage/methylation domain-containing protein [Gammaproteobacteria bacterium]NIR90070.1 prepilin-type N-terminal cleavage/methylation domain-containing protein [Gammaproteobacteria bacterium]NIU03274.1 prepilin-type N-terminal cleavage/methylation domain-containing protein [Gammaproteobacteria bacterium]NIV50768.1 prepilin-type N-terminal cleavage/methylation domain-containing protein [Gammaproteobacteria bacterium]NIV75354.1 prepilin-type N-terminal cleavage/methyl